MKVLFLDFDGVLSHGAWLHSIRRPGRISVDFNRYFDPAAIERVNVVLELTGASVVVSSSWRTGRPLSALREWLGGQGFKGKIVGGTPNIGDRGEEIRRWLGSCTKPIEQYAVVDDEDVNVPRKHFVRTDYASGLQDAHAVQLLDILDRTLPDHAGPQLRLA